MNKILLSAPLLCGLLACGGPPLDDDLPIVPAPDGQWELVWEDNFEGDAGQVLDNTRWGYNVGGTGWGNEQLEHNTDRAINVSMDGQGNLAITARQESFGGNAYTSARIVTQDLFEQAYGRFEARIKLPSGQGIWPAFWMLGADFPEVGWPECGEIDILELRGQEPDRVHGSVHGPGYSGGSPISATYTLPNGQRFDEDFHTFAVEWDPGRIAWYVDDILYQVITESSVPAGGRWVFDHPFFVILNVAVGGNYVGPPNAQTSFPQAMLIDHVRIFRRSP